MKGIKMQLSYECVTCKALVNFSKQDVMQGNIPKTIYCHKCQQKTGWVKEIKSEGTPFAGDSAIGKVERKKWERK